MPEPRYKVVKGSESQHCCFNYTVVDTHKVEDAGGGAFYFETVCECFKEKYATIVCNALNTIDGEGEE